MITNQLEWKCTNDVDPFIKSIIILPTLLLTLSEPQVFGRPEVLNDSVFILVFPSLILPHQPSQTCCHCLGLGCYAATMSVWI